MGNIMPTVSTTPFEVAQSIAEIGERIRRARVRRQISQADLAQSCQISRRTLYGIETGTPGAAIGHVFTVLWVLGLLNTVAGIADPNNDEHGKILEAARQPKRVRQQGVSSDDHDF